MKYVTDTSSVFTRYDINFEEVRHKAGSISVDVLMQKVADCDIGQMIVNALLSAAGFEVINLGADVPVDQVVRACKIHRPIMVTGTALMTTTMTAFPRIAAQLEALNLNIPFVCGGGAVSEEFVTSYTLGIWGKEASWAAEMAEDALGGTSWTEMRAKWNG
jgi:methanol corrinoid protein